MPNARHADKLSVRCVAVVSLCICAAFGAPRAEGPAIDVAVRARTLQPGGLIVLTITTPADVTRVSARAFGAEAQGFRVADRTWRALVGVDLDQRPGRYALVVAAQGATEVFTTESPLVVRSRKFPVRRLTVDPGFVNPSPTLRDRIDAEAALVREAYAHSAAEPLWQAPFVRPVPGPVVSRFGARSVFNGEPRGEHAGADFLSPAGTPIEAPNAGRIVIARPLFLSGNTVVIDHGLGLFSMLAHLSRVDIVEGQSVERGQIVGLVGATGRVTGPHLHWALRAGAARIDPVAALALLQAEPIASGGRHPTPARPKTKR